MWIRASGCLPPRATIKSASVRILPPFAWKWSRISSNHRFSTPISGSAPPKSFLLRRFADHDLLSSSSSSSLYALLARSFSCNGLQVRARIEVAVLNFLKNLTASNPAISDLPLVCLSPLCFSPCSGFASNLCYKWVGKASCLLGSSCL